MNSIDLVKRWTVIKNTENNIKCYWYGSFESFIRDGCREDEKLLWTEIPFDKWTSKDLIEIFRNDLEDANEHQWTWAPQAILTHLIHNKIPEKKRFDIILGLYVSWLTF